MEETSSFVYKAFSLLLQIDDPAPPFMWKLLNHRFLPLGSRRTTFTRYSSRPKGIRSFENMKQLLKHVKRSHLAARRQMNEHFFGIIIVFK